jgi:thiopeptide-type bacteriocin biosynthesis protein
MPQPIAGGEVTQEDRSLAPAGWESWHLHLGSAAPSLHDRVLVDVVAPAVEALAGRPWFFVRYWQAGPHLRVRVHGLAPGESVDLENALRAGLAERGLPGESESPVDPAWYAANAERLASAGESGVAMAAADLLPPGLYRKVYEPEVERYGGPSLMPGAESLFALSSSLVIDALRARADTRARAVMAMRATICAVAALGDADEGAAYYARGVESWRTWAAGAGYSERQLDQLCGVGEDSAGTRTAARPIAPADVIRGPLAPWHAQFVTAVESWRRVPAVQPGRLLFSHIHMLHNRLGLNVAEELQTYARLARVFRPTTTSGGAAMNGD